MKLSQRQIDALGHLVDHCRKASELANRFPTRESLTEDWEAQYALVRCLEILGEASNRLGPAFHGGHPEVPWRQITGMRNRLVHGYDQVQLDLLWETATEDIPVLLSVVETILEQETPKAASRDTPVPAPDAPERPK